MVSNFYAEHKHELKTERGWNLAKRKVKEGAKRHMVWQGFCEYEYIFEADTEPMTDEEFKEYKHQEYLEKKEKEKEKRRELIKKALGKQKNGFSNGALLTNGLVK